MPAYVRVMALATTTVDRPIRFRFAAKKALAAVCWMLREQSGLDLHTILKAAYFADRMHLNEHGRPVFGARYKAMKFGPVPLEIYEMLKGEPYWLSELERDDYPWRLTGHRVHSHGGEQAVDQHVSASDWLAIKAGLALSRSMTFDERTAATHGPDWQRAALGWMDYADMVEVDRPDREALIGELRMIAPRLAL
jgi:hypothetical protein